MPTRKESHHEKKVNCFCNCLYCHGFYTDDAGCIATQVEHERLALIDNYFEKSVSKQTLINAADKFEMLENLSIPVSDILTSIQPKSDGLMAFYLDYGTVVEEVIPIQETNGILYLITGGGKYNEFFIANNGDLYLDGNQIEFSSGVSNTVTRGQLISYGGWTETCPYGYPADYNVYGRTEQKTSVNFGKAVEALAVTTFTSIFFKNIWIGIGVTVAAFVYDHFVNVAPYSEAGSYSIKVYYHKNTSEFWIYNSPTYRIGAEKHVGTFYPFSNYGGNSTQVIQYNYLEYK